MIYKEFAESGIKSSIIGLGGHEFLENGKSRGFNEDFEKAVTPGYFFEGFGGEKRKRIIKAAVENNINFFDVTIDSEKEALGRNLTEIRPPCDSYIQTRPEGMVYSYDENNTQMADYDLLKEEVERILKLIKRKKIDFFNFAFMKSALKNDPDYLDKIEYNIKNLKKEGLIRFACADTFSGEETYLKQIKAGCFDAIYINFNFANSAAANKVLPLAKEKGMMVITREPFMKGSLFKMGREIGVENRDLLARTSLKWILNQTEVDIVVMGVDNVEQLENNLSILDNLELSPKEVRLIQNLKNTDIYKNYSQRREGKFCGN